MEHFTHGGDIYSEPRQWLDFSANINPLGLTENVRRAINENIKNIINYPDPKNSELMETVANAYDISQDNIILGNGASELIYLFFSCMRFKKVLILAPSFSDYERAALATNCEIEFLRLNESDNFALPLEKLKNTANNFDLIVLASPNNPTGTLIENEHIKNLLETDENKPFIFIDESFMDFIPEKEKHETLKLAASSPRLFTLHSLTKFYALPGLRLGFGACHKKIVKKLSDAKDIWNVNILAAKAGITALKDEDYKKNTLAWLKREQVFLTEKLKELNIKFFTPTANFILLKFENENISIKIQQELKARGILTRNCENFVGLDASFVRIAVKSREDNEKLINNLREIIS